MAKCRGVLRERDDWLRQLFISRDISYIWSLRYYTEQPEKKAATDHGIQDYFFMLPVRKLLVPSIIIPDPGIWGLS